MNTEQLHSDLILGSVIHGTHRPQELIPAFLDLLAIVDGTTYAGYMVSSFHVIPAYAMEDDSSEWWDSMDATNLLENLFNDLDNASPKGYYFGDHPGNGSDFGYWEIEQ